MSCRFPFKLCTILTPKRSSKYLSHVGSYGFASPLIFVCRSMGDRVCVEELDFSCRSILFLYFSAEHPVPLSNGMKVFIFHPFSRFLWVSSFGPLPQCSEDRIIHFHEGLFARYVPVIVCPTPDFGIKLHYQVPGCRLSIF